MRGRVYSTTSRSRFVKWRRCWGTNGYFFIKVIDLDWVNSDFSVYFLKFIHIDPRLSDSK